MYGIDLGTTYSAIAYVDEHGKPAIVPNQESERITLRGALRPRQHHRRQHRQESAKVEPHRVVSRIKQHMGDPISSSSTRPGLQPGGHLVVHPPQGRRRCRDCRRRRADHRRRDHLSGLFRDARAEATANAGRLAGLNIRAILNEPTAAAIAYGLEQGEDQTVLVYDLGGGTFDITMIEIKDRLIRVICTGGDHRLGGTLRDEAIVMYLAEQFQLQTGVDSDPMDDPEVSTTCSSRPSAARRR